ncbi:MAG: hypothetical protein HKM04_02955, partial [Legionellales bacterium]|nr:hypothetical protein [Legionellales bacterium]
MKQQGIPINLEVLKWAMSSAGYTRETEVHEFPKFNDWELGISFPTYSQLEKLAQRYKRPVALFFFPEPPAETPIEKDLRSLTSEDLIHLTPKVRHLFRKAKSFQLSLQELYAGKITEQKNKLTWLKIQFSESIPTLAGKIRGLLGANTAEIERLGSEDEALEFWREKLYEKGIFVFKDAFKDNDVSGFCIYDEEFPI